MDVIERVDQLIKKQHLQVQRYKCVKLEKKQQEIYQQQLQEHDKKRKKDALKPYAQIIKQGNKKAIQRTKQKQKQLKKSKIKKVIPQPQIQNQQNLKNNGQIKKHKLNETQIKKVQQAIQTRAQKLLQQKQLQKLNKCLNEQKKKTKLYQLDKKCRKIANSSVKLIPAATSTSNNNEVPEHKKILEQFQQQVLNEVHQIDNAIQQILNRKQQNRNSTAKIKKNTQHPKPATNTHIQYQNLQTKKIRNPQNKFDPFQHPIFTKSPEQLLSLQYIQI